MFLESTDIKTHNRNVQQKKTLTPKQKQITSNNCHFNMLSIIMTHCIYTLRQSEAFSQIQSRIAKLGDF